MDIKASNNNFNDWWIHREGQTFFAICVYCQIKWMICENIFTGVHCWESGCMSNPFLKITYLAMCFNTWERLALVHGIQSVKEWRHLYLLPMATLLHLHSSLNHFHIFLHTPWVRMQVLSILWSQWKSVIRLAWYGCCKKLESFPYD